MKKKGKKGKKGKGCGKFWPLAIVVMGIFWISRVFAQAEVPEEAVDWITKWDNIVAVLLPLLISTIVKEAWNAVTRAWVSFAVVAAFAFVRVFISYDFTMGNLVKMGIETLSVTGVAYLVFWKPSGIGEAIKKNIGVK